jgi:menaquinone-dependent protoporphyrinogen oxidase
MNRIPETKSESKVLVAYASKSGSTAEIAKRITRVLEGEGHKVQLLDAGEVDQIDEFDAVVLGSAVYAGQWRKSAVELMLSHESSLSGIPVWLFSSGPTGEGDPREIMNGWNFPDSLQAAASRIQPRDKAFFHGVLDPDRLSLPEKLIVKGLGAPLGDFRDWEKIETWSKTIAEHLSKGEQV